MYSSYVLTIQYCVLNYTSDIADHTGKTPHKFSNIGIENNINSQVGYSYNASIPIAKCKCSNFPLERGLVNILAIISFVG